MITIESLIAVLFKVIIIITAHPDIPQDVKDSVFTQINQAITQENAVVNTPVVESPAVGGAVSEPVVVEPVSGDVIVGQCDSFRGQEFSISTTGNWNRAYLSIKGFNKNPSGDRTVSREREVPKGESIFLPEMRTGGQYDYALVIDGQDITSGSLNLEGCLK